MLDDYFEKVRHRSRLPNEIARMRQDARHVWRWYWMEELINPSRGAAGIDKLHASKVIAARECERGGNVAHEAVLKSYDKVALAMVENPHGNRYMHAAAILSFRAHLPPEDG